MRGIMSEEFEESSEQTDSTPAVEEDSSQESSEGAEAQEAAPEKEQERESIPLNDPRNPYYERFTELTTQNREFKGRLGEYDQTIRQLQQEMAVLRTAQAPKKEEAPYKPILDHLETIDPSFAKFQRELVEKAETANKRAEIAEALQKRLDAMETRDFQTQAVSRFHNLLETNKVPENLRQRYEREIRILATDLEAQGQKLGLQDVDKLFNTVHSEYTKFLEDIRRAERASYVKAKRSDVTPAPATGGAAVSTAPTKIKAGDDESLVKWMAKQLRDAKNV